MVEFGRFGILADGRPIRLGGRVLDVLMALIEASQAVVSEGRAFEPRLADRGSDASHLRLSFPLSPD
jgi:hypothetical protein